jgi:NAD(P)-dependent dehydrogenase (short-subunit alcohol dehydrogenase family)
MRLDNTTAVVTGAASGLGRTVAHTLAQAGAHVLGLDLAAGIGCADRIPGVDYRPVDITRAKDVADAVEHAAESGPLRVVVNCAGMAPSARILRRGAIHDLDLFARTVNVNLVGTFNVMTLAAQHIAETEPDAQGQRGVIINTASVAAFDGQIGQSAYAASKGGVVALTLPAARDLAAHGVRVCTIAPGIMDTPMMASFSDDVRSSLAAGVPFPQRLGHPEEYADLVLAIIRNDYLNGEVIRLDGALRMSAR